MAKTMTPAEVAEQFGSDGRTVRKFLRSRVAKENQPGKGSRWEIPATAADLKKLRKAFDEWTAAAEAKKEATAEVVPDPADTEDENLDT